MTQYLAETREGLLAMVRLAQAQDDVLVQVTEAGRPLWLNICFSAPTAVGFQLRVAAGARHDAPHAGAGGGHHLAEPTVLQVRADPRKVAELRSTFLKLSSAMEGTMVRWERWEVVMAQLGRLGEAGSRELYPVCQYYSGTLVTYIRTVLQVSGLEGGEAGWSIGHTCHHVVYR